MVRVRPDPGLESRDSRLLSRDTRWVSRMGVTDTPQPRSARQAINEVLDAGCSTR